MTLHQYLAMSDSGQFPAEPLQMGLGLSYLFSVGVFANKLGYSIGQNNRVYKGTIFLGFGLIPLACLFKICEQRESQTSI